VIFRVIKNSHEEEMHTKLETLLWENFDCIKKSLILIPKLSMQSFMRDDIKENLTDVFSATHRLITGSDDGSTTSKS
jgi:hypothetical protein